MSAGRVSSSIMASTMAVVPTFRKVATSARLASPTMTWRRRYFWLSQCGSSRVLTIGRFSVVSRPTSSSKKSDRWLSWNGTSAADTPGASQPDLAGAGEDLAGDEVGRDLGHDAPERHLAGHEVVLVAAVAVALAVGVVLVDHDLGAGRQGRRGRLHRLLQDLLGGAVPHHDLAGVGALGRGDLGVGVVDVVARAVGEHRVDQVRLHVGRHGALGDEAPGVASGRLVLEVPAGAPVQQRHVGVDQHGRRGDRVRLARAAHDDPVLGLDAADLADGHGRTLPR